MALTTAPSVSRSGTEDPVAGPSRLDSLTALRFIAALGVFCYHARIYFEHNAGFWLVPMAAPGKTGVSLFFVLSGFVLAWSSRPADTARRFWRRRFARIYPIYATALLLGGVMTVLEGHRLAGSHVAATLTLTQSWVPRHGVYHAIDAPAWSLSVETLFYATFPLVLPLLRRCSPRARAAVLAACVAVTTGWELYGAFGELSVRTGYWAVTVLPVARLPEFVLGATMALELRRMGRSPVRLRHAAIATVVAVAAVAVVSLDHHVAPSRPATASMTLVPFALLIVALAGSDAFGRSALGRHRFLVRWGERSYAFYLVHAIVIRGHQLLDPVRDEGLLKASVITVVLLAISMTLAALLYRWVEKPLERRLRGNQPRPAPMRVPAQYPSEPDLIPAATVAGRSAR